jgi:hypothetical protein
MRFREFKEAFGDDGWDDLISKNMSSMLSGGGPSNLLKYFNNDQTNDQNSKDSKSVSNISPSSNTSKPSSNTSKPSKSPANQQQMSSYLASKGLSRQHIGGIMANIKHESSFNPAAIGDGGTSGGLFQHHGSRFQAMVRAAGPNWKTNWKGQIDFALSEPAGRQYAAMSFRTAEEASKWFTINFEVPANKVAKANDRSRDASQFA